MNGEHQDVDLVDVDLVPAESSSSINVREHYNCNTKGKLKVHIEKFAVCS
jgi:hypothetical protein